jgi:hypothetical protein
MAIKTFTDLTTLPASDINTYLANSGLVYIASLPMGSGGASFDNVFTSEYDHYKIVMSDMRVASTTFFFLRFRAGGTDSATSYYFAGVFRLFSGGGGDEGGNNVSNFALGTCSPTIPTAGVVEIQNPRLAQTTTFQRINSNFDAGVYAAGNHQQSVAYDGFSVIPNATTFVGGRVTCYGYRKA